MEVNYRLKYNFGQYQNQITKIFQNLINKSIQFFGQQIANGKILRNNSNYNDPQYYNDPQLRKELIKLESFVSNIEEYLYYYYLNNLDAFPNILNAVSEVKAISVLDDSDKGIYGITHPTGVIQINPNLSGNGILTPDERTRLYVAHELGHMVNRTWMDSVTKFLSTDKRLSPNDKTMFYEGFSLIDEATTQDRAENIAYYYAHKQRNCLRNYSDPSGMYGGDTYRTNFDFYGELEPPVIAFGRTLRGIGSIENDERVMNVLGNRALKPNFADNIIYEYRRDGQIDNLYAQMQYMGMLKKASYARFGYDDVIYLKNSKRVFDTLNFISKKLRDYREPFE